MLNIRTFILSVALVVIFVVTVGLVTARTGHISDASSDPAIVSEFQERPADLDHTYIAPSYRAKFGECFDRPLREAAACPNAGPAPIQAEPSSRNE